MKAGFYTAATSFHLLSTPIIIYRYFTRPALMFHVKHYWFAIYQAT